MAVVIQVAGIPARIDGYKWTSKSKALENLLNSMLDPFGPPTSDPDPDATVAEQIVQLLEGTVIYAHGKNTRKPGVIY